MRWAVPLWAIAATTTAISMLAASDADAQQSAAPNDKQACVDAFESAQAMRQEGKLSASRARLATCVRPTCPALVREECARYTDEVVRATPSIVIAARDAQGRDIAGASLLVDGASIADGLGGRPLELDPGVHQLRVEATGMTMAEQRIVMREGDRGRPVTIVMQASEASSPAPATAPTSRPAPILAYTLLGVGAAAMGTGLVLDLSVDSDVKHLRTSCAPHCSQDDVDGAKTRYYTAIALGGVGLAAASVGAILLFTRPKDSVGSETGFSIGPSPRGANVSWHAQF
jgi:hypothetical protein